MANRLFWLISRAASLAYRYFPVFGPLRGAVAIIRKDGGFIAVRRNDGYGICFPGGLSRPWEANEITLRREVHEETGLQVTRADFKFSFKTFLVYPTLTCVFEAEAVGELKNSWEGTVTVLTLDELDRSIMPTQRAIVTYLQTGHPPETSRHSN